MSLLELPHTNGCVACGRRNSVSLRLSLFVDPQSGAVSANFRPLADHVGFNNIVHGGVLATVLDEAMVWAATWAGGRFCLCGELSVRYRRPAIDGHPLKVLASVASQRPKLIEVTGELINEEGEVIAEASGKFVPVSAQSNRDIVDTLLPEPAVAETLKALREAAGV